MTAPLPSVGQWSRWFLDDLNPTPGRLASSARIVLTVSLALILLLILQVTFVSVSLYMIFVLARESPAVSLRSGLLLLAATCLAVLIELTVVIWTDNDPMVRLLSVAAVTFVAGALTQASSFAPLAPTLGLLYCNVIALWESQAPADRIVKNSLYLIAAEGITLGCAVFIEYLFATRNPVERLQEERRNRYRALERMFRAYARGAAPDDLFAAYLPVARLALAGQRGMQELYGVIVQRNLDPTGLPLGIRVRISLLVELVDASAAFAAGHPSNEDPDLRERCGWIADRLSERATTYAPQSGFLREPRSEILPLRRVQEILETIMAMPVDSGDPDDKKLIVLPALRVPFFIPGALKARGTFTFGLKISFCATLCYILYHALDYPEISTAVTTVLVSGLTTTGAMKQKLAHRLAGAIVGGLLLGLGSIVFLFPHMDSITALSGLVAAVTFIAAWSAAGRRFGYIGLQIAFSFFTVTLHTSSAPTELAPARDRLVGIGLALLIMWFVFDQVWPIRTITMMRQALASILRGEAQLLSVAGSEGQSAGLGSRIDGLRHEVSARIAEMRSLHEAVLYEFGVDHESHKAAGETMLRAALTSGSLLWTELAVLERKQDRYLLTDEELVKIRHAVAKGLETMAEAVVEQKPVEPLRGPGLDGEHFPPGAREAQYANNLLSRYKEVESILLNLPVSVTPVMGRPTRNGV